MCECQSDQIRMQIFFNRRDVFYSLSSAVKMESEHLPIAENLKKNWKESRKSSDLLLIGDAEDEKNGEKHLNK